MCRLIAKIILLLLFSEVLFCEEPKEIEIHGIVLVGSSESISEGERKGGIHFRAINLPGNTKTLSRRLSSLIGKNLNQKNLVDGEQIILDYYKESGHPFVMIDIPEQKVSDGVVHYLVKEGKVGNLKFSGNEWTPTTQLKKTIRQKENEPVDIKLLQQDMIWLNRNPFRDTVMVLNPGEEEGSTDIQFISEDHFPYRIYVGGDNTGFESTGKGRFFAGVNFGNLFHLDQRLSYQYTVSTKWGSFYAHTGQYIIPLPWRHILEFYGGYSGIRATMPISRMKSSGNAWQASMRYIIPLTSVRAYTHEIKVGVDYKQTNVNLVFDAIPILGNEAVITQLFLGYNASFEHPIANTSLEVQWFMSPGDIFSHQSNRDYSSLRPYAKARYTYFRSSIIPVFKLPKDFEAVLRSEFQVASRNLLSSEQFGLGGLYTVRGYDERIVNTDNAFFLSGELRTPPIGVFIKNPTKPSEEMLQFLTFIDYGFGANDQTIPGARSYLYLLSTGLGVRYRYKYHVNCRVDWGAPLHRHIQKGVTQTGSHFNFSLIFSY
ncbi:MAG: ShlB/FhaC/HecB family hemolysin secretion/activation protein [Simkaniaceae bacterium]|nr:MAG: ShlB/FhaC/HecB family hemolysin secretion/activation protein [Simkaniaceae bacterium]